MHSLATVSSQNLSRKSCWSVQLVRYWGPRPMRCFGAQVKKRGRS